MKINCSVVQINEFLPLKNSTNMWNFSESSSILRISMRIPERKFPLPAGIFWNSRWGREFSQIPWIWEELGASTAGFETTRAKALAYQVNFADAWTTPSKIYLFFVLIKLLKFYNFTKLKTREMIKEGANWENKGYILLEWEVNLKLWETWIATKNFSPLEEFVLGETSTIFSATWIWLGNIEKGSKKFVAKTVPRMRTNWKEP